MKPTLLNIEGRWSILDCVVIPPTSGRFGGTQKDALNEWKSMSHRHKVWLKCELSSAQKQYEREYVGILKENATP